MADMHMRWTPSQPRQSRLAARRPRGKRRVLARLCVISTALGIVFFGAKYVGQSFGAARNPVVVQVLLPGPTAALDAAVDTVAGAASVPAGQGTLAEGALDLATCRRAAARLQPDLMMPERFLESYKRAPCWTALDGKTACLPSFLLAGGFQSGAGTLAAKLAAHPHIKTGPSSNAQFWGEYAKGVSEYLGGFAEAVEALQPETDLLMDNSQSTFSFYWSAGGRTHTAFRSTMEACWRNCSETAAGDAEQRDACVAGSCFSAAQAADHKAITDAGIEADDAHVPLLVRAAYGPWPIKLIVLLRNPIDRLQSAYWTYGHYHNKYGQTAEGFAKYVDEQASAFEGCAARHGTPNCALYFESLGPKEEALFFHADQFIRGMHSVFLSRWLRHIPRERMLIIRAEEYFRQTEKTVRQVLEFLGLQPPEDMTAILQAGNPFSTADKPRMLPATRERLHKFYQPFNDQLSRLLKDPAYLEWNWAPVA